MTSSGLRENASREEVIEAFDALKKRYEQNRSGNRQPDSAGSWERLKEITGARDTLLGYLANHEPSAIREEGQTATPEALKDAGYGAAIRRRYAKAGKRRKAAPAVLCRACGGSLFLLGLLYLYGSGP